MVIITNNTINTLVLNINNNSRDVFLDYVVKFTHSLSEYTRSYTISLSDNTQYGSNDRFCEIILDLRTTRKLVYEGQHKMEVLGDGARLVYTTLADVRPQFGDDQFIQYQSDNESGEKYIHV